jgi:hypothetical protein
MAGVTARPGQSMANLDFVGTNDGKRDQGVTRKGEVGLTMVRIGRHGQ